MDNVVYKNKCLDNSLFKLSHFTTKKLPLINVSLMETVSMFLNYSIIMY